MTTIQPRSAWGAGANRRVDRGSLVSSALTGLTLHWPGGGANLTRLRGSQVAAQLRTWQAQHRNQGWDDIGYNFLIDGGGTIWEGCGWYRGAHAGSGTGNRTTVGIQLITGTNEGPTAAQVEAVKWFRANQLFARNGRATWIGPHSHWTGTACPGNSIRALINQGAFTGSASTGGFLMALSDSEQREVLQGIRDLRPGRRGQYSDGPGFAIIRRAASRVNDLHRSWSPSGKLRTMTERGYEALMDLRPGRAGSHHDGPGFRLIRRGMNKIGVK